jgi:hypothetical protein
MVHTTSFVFLNIINSSAPAIKKKLPLIRIGYYAKGETMVPPLSLPLKEQLGRHAIIILREIRVSRPGEDVYFGGTH